MTIASEITALNTNLTAAKNAVTAKGGTVGDTGLAGLAAEIATIPAGGQTSTSGATLTAYDSTTGVLTGTGLGTTGTVYLLDRNTHTYVAQPTSAWSATSITLTTPIDLSTLEGTTSIAAVAPNGTWSTKLLITGEVAVTGWAKLYIQNPDTRAVRTITIDNSTGFNKLYNSDTSGYAKQITIDEDTFYFDEIVGMQFGDDFAGTSISAYFLQCATNLNQPLAIPSSVTSTGTNFLSYCSSFNQPLDTSSVTSIGTNFLYYCYSFNQPLDTSSVTSIGDNFLYYCAPFNQPLDTSSVTSIGNNFLYYCSSFNQPVDISSVTSIGDSFLRNCPSFNQPLTVPSSATSIGNYFLAYCSSFSQPLEISSVTSVGNFFLAYCSSFNQPVDISSVTSIGSNFLRNCSSFNQSLTIPSSLTSIGTNFLNNCSAFTSLTTETTASPTDNNTLATLYSTAKMYAKGVTVTGAGASTWITNLPNRTASPYRKLIQG